jgi:succinate dehydrogenase/fumarate reductase flavoprotein subunit
VADVVIAGAGASGLSAAVMARDQGASVLVIDENHDIGGHAMLSGGRLPLGGGTSLQKKFGITTDSADQVYADHTNHKNPEFRYCDRDLVRMWANENAATFEFLIENGVKFVELAPSVVNGGTVPRLFLTQVFSNDLKQTINGRNGSGLVRPLEASARAKGVTFLLRHKMSAIVRENPTSGKVLGITARYQDKDVHIQARKGVIISTGGHTSNVEFRRIFDPRLTEEYQVTGEPWSRQNADGEILAMSIGAGLWATANQNTGGLPITKTQHIGCRYGYQNLKWNPQSPMFSQAGASGLTVNTFQDLILVNQVGQRFWNEMDRSDDFLHACLSRNGNMGSENGKANGGGPIWAIFDADAVAREKWDPKPPNVDLNGWFFAADTLGELARRIKNPFQRLPIPADALEQTVAKYNSFVDSGKDAEFGKPTPMFKVQKPPYYAAWSTPILHDTLTGLRINTKCQVIDLHGNIIPGLYCAGESAGGFALHGLPRVTVFGRVAGREAARAAV